MVFTEIEMLSVALASALIQVGQRAIRERGRFLLALNGGGTPQRLFELLGERPFTATNIWPNTDVFWGDERIVPPDQIDSSYMQATRAFLNMVDIDSNRIHRIKSELTPEEAAGQYADLLASFAADDRLWPRFDLVLLGLGTDGHTASLFPGQAKADPNLATLAVYAAYEDRPAARVSLTPAVFNDARLIYWMAVGADKAESVSKAVQGEFTKPEIPANLINPGKGEMVWWLDEASARGLYVRGIIE